MWIRTCIIGYAPTSVREHIINFIGHSSPQSGVSNLPPAQMQLSKNVRDAYHDPSKVIEGT